MNLFSVFDVLFSSDSILNLCVSLITVFAITLIFKTSTTTNFAQTTISTFGAYFVANLSFVHGVNIWISFVLGLILCGGIGLFIDTMVLRKGRHVNAVGKQIITMGFTYVLLALVLIVVPIKEGGVWVQIMPDTAFVDTTNVANAIHIGSYTLAYNTIICAALAIIVLTILFICIYKTKWGLGVRMTASNETVAQMVGVNTHFITAISWSIAAAMGCLAAVSLNNRPGKLSTSIMTSVQLLAFLGCVVGGFTTFYGPLLATAILWLIGNLISITGMYLPAITTWKEVIVYVVGMIFVLFKPWGLFGKVARKKV